MSIKYEWDVETVDVHGDVQDHDHDDSLDTLLHRHDLGEGKQLVLVRDVFQDDCLKDRSWSYVTNGKLELHFSGGNHGPSNVPARFHAELAKQLLAS